MCSATFSNLKLGSAEFLPESLIIHHSSLIINPTLSPLPASKRKKRDKRRIASCFAFSQFYEHSHPRFCAMCSCPLSLPNVRLCFCASTTHNRPLGKGLSRKRALSGSFESKLIWRKRNAALPDGGLCRGFPRRCRYSRKRAIRRFPHGRSI